MKIQLLLTGNELMAGDIVDSNSSMIADYLGQHGWRIARKVTVGDDMELLVSEIKALSANTDVLIINGGLGPTVDDLTAQALALASGVRLAEHPEAIIDGGGGLVLRPENRALLARAAKTIWLDAADALLAERVGAAEGRPLLVASPLARIRELRRDRLVHYTTAADAIIATDDIDGIADLLGNDSAQLREEALDNLIDRSEGIELWQAPLVTRTKLPEGAAQRMAGFIAENLLDKLRQRADLDDASLAAVSEIVRRRLGHDGTNRKPLNAAFDFLKLDPPLDTAQRLFEAEKLTDEVVVKALQAGDHAFVFAAIIVRAGVSTALARKIFVEKSPKGIVSLLAKADLPASMIVMTQQQMGRIAPTEIIKPEGKGDDAEIPLDEDEIDWQIEFFTDMTERG